VIALGSGNSSSFTAPLLIVGTIAALSAAIVTDTAVKPALALSLLVVVVATLHRSLVSWVVQINVIVAIVLFIPMRRYALPAALPFQLDPYRVFLALVVIGWVGALLADGSVRFRGSYVDAPLLGILFVSAASIAVNYRSIESLHHLSSAVKELTFLASYLVFFYVVVGLVRNFDGVDSIVRMFVGGTTFVGVAGIVEFWTHYNVFDHVARKIPLLHQTAAPLEVFRGGHLRILASSQHPIALGALFAMAVPFALYLYHRYQQRRWLASIVVFAMAAMATGSRTAVVMLIVVVLVFVMLRPRQTVRFWPVLIPMVVLVHFAMPGTIGSFYKLFFPKGGLVAEQADAGVGSSRVTSLGPGLHLIGLDPLFGGGYGARVFGTDDPNAFIVDDQWLSTGIDTGILGIAVWLWFFVRFLRPMFRAARREVGSRGWFYSAVAASVTGYAVGLLTYDAFSYIQVTFVLFLVAAIGCAAYRLEGDQPHR
jgi:O-Antigen ligase